MDITPFDYDQHELFLKWADRSTITPQQKRRRMSRAAKIGQEGAVFDQERLKKFRAEEEAVRQEKAEKKRKTAQKKTQDKAEHAKLRKELGVFEDFEKLLKKRDECNAEVQGLSQRIKELKKLRSEAKQEFQRDTGHPSMQYYLHI